MPGGLHPFALRGAARTAVVAPTVLAIGYYLIGDEPLSLFAWFAAFALLVFVDFDGPPRTRFAAYGLLALAGLPLIVLGTLCSRSPWAATGGMLVVAFLILLSGVINGYLAIASPAALLAFVLPVMTPAPLSAVPERLAGWGLGTGAALLSIAFLWPARPPDEMRRALAAACRALADCVAAQRDRDESGVRDEVPGDRDRDGRPEVMAVVVRSAVAEVRRRFTATSYRPTGAGGPAAALGRLVVDLNWLVPFAVPAPGDDVVRTCFPAPAAEVRAAVTQTLLAAADRLDWVDRRVDRRLGGGVDDGPSGPGGLGIERLDRAARAVGAGLLAAVPRTEESSLSAVAEQAFRLRQLAHGTRDLALNCLRVTADPRPGHWLADRGGWRRAQDRARAARDLAGGYVDPRAVWFRNSVRGAVGLALAVAITQTTGVQHGFWVVLGTLSVLRSNALATGSTVLRALVGTASGIALGGLVVVAIGTARPVLWLLLPISVLLAGYARKANAFGTGQAGFTVSVLILFNIIEPVGWRVGLVRIEDVIIGFLISLVVGLLLWPRGAAPELVRDRAAAAYRRAIEFLALVVAQPPAPPGERPPAEIAQVGREALRAGRLLDDAIRQYLAEPPAGRLDLDALMTVAAGAARLRRTARILWLAVPNPARPEVVPRHRLRLPPALAVCRTVLLAELAEFRTWILDLADALARASDPPAPSDLPARLDPPVRLDLPAPLDPPSPLDPLAAVDRSPARSCALDQVRVALRAGDHDEVAAALDLVERAEHLSVLRVLRPRLVAAARSLASEQGRGDHRGGRQEPGDRGPGRRRPWFRRLDPTGPGRRGPAREPSSEPRARGASRP